MPAKNRQTLCWPLPAVDLSGDRKPSGTLGPVRSPHGYHSYMANAYRDNSAGTLFLILRSIKQAERNLRPPAAESGSKRTARNGVPGEVTVSEWLSSLNNLRFFRHRDDLNDIPLFRKAMILSDILNLPIAARQEIELLSDDNPKDLMLRWWPKTVEAIGRLTGAATPISKIASIYGEGELTSLEFSSAILHHAHHLPGISNEDLVEIKRRLTELLDAIRSDATLNPELADLLRTHISSMIRACTNYEFQGSADIRDAYNETIGALVNNWHIVVRHDDSRTGIWQKVIGVLGALSALLGFGTAVIAALEAPSASPAVEIVVPTRALLPPTILGQQRADEQAASRGESNATPKGPTSNH
jgi:hypothetical protein